MTKRKLSRRDSVDLWLATTAKLLGHACVVVGAVGFVASGFTHADQTMFGTGVLLIGGGHGAELLATLRKPPEDDPR